MIGDETPVKRTQEEWDDTFFDLAEVVSFLSKDPDRKVGAILVTPDRRQLSVGYNGFPSTIPDLPRLLADKEFKLRHMVHAEVNCCDQAPFETAGCTLYVTRFPCHVCAARLVQACVARVVAPHFDYGHHRWGASWATAERFFQRNDIQFSKRAVA